MWRASIIGTDWIGVRRVVEVSRMAMYRVYRIMEMHGWQDIEAANPEDAVDILSGDDDPENWTMDGYGSGNQFYVYSEDGKILRPQPTFNGFARVLELQRVFQKFAATRKEDADIEKP